MLPLPTIMDCPERHVMPLRELWGPRENVIVLILSSIPVILRRGVTIMASLSVPVDYQEAHAMRTQRLSSCRNFAVPAPTSTATILRRGSKITAQPLQAIRRYT